MTASARPPVVRSLSLILALAAIHPALAGAQERGLAPPGNSAIFEYTEAVPTGEGDRLTTSIAASRGRPLPGRIARPLRAAGPEGRRLEAIAAATAPAAALRAAQARPVDAGSPAARAPAAGGPASTPGSDDSHAPLGSIADAVLADSAPGAGGLGAVLPVLLAAVLIGVLLARFGHRPEGP